jgi:hypothetical protein
MNKKPMPYVEPYLNKTMIGMAETIMANPLNYTFSGTMTKDAASILGKLIIEENDQYGSEFAEYVNKLVTPNTTFREAAVDTHLDYPVLCFYVSDIINTINYFSSVVSKIAACYEGRVLMPNDRK